MPARGELARPRDADALRRGLVPFVPQPTAILALSEPSSTSQLFACNLLDPDLAPARSEPGVERLVKLTEPSNRAEWNVENVRPTHACVIPHSPHRPAPVRIGESNQLHRPRQPTVIRPDL